MVRKYTGLYCLMFVAAGIVLADLTAIPSWPCLLAAFISLVAGFYLHAVTGRAAAAAVALGTALMAFSAFHYTHRYLHAGPRHISSIVAAGSMYSIYGRVADWPEVKSDRTEVKIAVDSLAAPDLYDVEGNILLKVSDTTTALQRGDRVAFRARLYPLPSPKGGGGFDYRRYLTLKGISGIVYLSTLLDVRIDRRPTYSFLTFIDRLREEVTGSLSKNLSPTAAAMAKGFLIGETRDIPPEIYRMFRDSGTLHVLAVSGSNVALVIMFVMLVMWPFGIRPGRRRLILIAVIAVFAGMSYGEPSVIRASVMAVLVILARYVQRRHDLNNIIALTAVIILLADPAQFYDVGFQLSFVTAWGLIFIVPRIADSLGSKVDYRWWRWFYLPLAVAVTAQVCSAPLIAFYFGRIPLTTVLANLVIVPLVSLAVMGILAVLVAHLVLPVLGAFAGSLVNQLLMLVLGALRVFGGDHVPVIQFEYGWPAYLAVPVVLMSYLVIVAGSLSMRSLSARRFAIVLILLMANGAAAVGLWRSAGSPRELLTVHQVPGGIAAIVHREGTETADLVFAGLRGKPYPIDARIIAPKLMQQGISRLNSIFVLGADFDAVDDIVRLAGSYAAAGLYVTESLGPSFYDHILSDSIPSSGITLVRPIREDTTLEGYWMDQKGLWLATGTGHVVFTTRLHAAHFAPLPEGIQPTLVIGEKWLPTPDDQRRLVEAGYMVAVCTSIEQRHPAAAAAIQPDPGSALPDNLISLDRAGPCQIELSAPK
ncbi:MAG: ComEC family competence protein [Candidatus Zixiibacteriota bacterium]|nr:MAG: ComEC family competence protein [candidate division Zixibacteria bacterium]